MQFRHKLCGLLFEPPCTIKREYKTKKHNVPKENNNERYYGPGRRPFAYLFYGKPHLRINIHHHAPPRTVLQQAGSECAQQL